MAAPEALLQQLHDEADGGMTDAERADLEAAIDTSIDEYEAGMTIPLETALRARSASRATR